MSQKQSNDSLNISPRPTSYSGLSGVFSFAPMPPVKENKCEAFNEQDEIRKIHYAISDLKDVILDLQVKVSNLEGRLDGMMWRGRE